MALILRVALLFCLIYYTSSGPVQTGLASNNNRVETEAQDASPKEKILLLQRKLADLQRNLHILEGTYGAVTRSPPPEEEEDGLAEILEQAVGIHIGKYDEYGDDDPFGVISEISDEDSQTVDNGYGRVLDTRTENIGGLTSDEKELLRMLKEKEAGKSRHDVLRLFLEERVGNRADKMSESNGVRSIDVARNHQQTKDVELSAEIAELERNNNEQGAILLNAPPSRTVVPDEGYFVDRPFKESELGPVKGVRFLTSKNIAAETQGEDIQDARLDEVEEKLLSDLKYAMDHGVTLSDLLNDVSDKEKASLQREALLLAEQLGDTQKEIEKLQLNAE